MSTVSRSIRRGWSWGERDVMLGRAARLHESWKWVDPPYLDRGSPGRLSGLGPSPQGEAEGDLGLMAMLAACRPWKPEWVYARGVDIVKGKGDQT